MSDLKAIVKAAIAGKGMKPNGSQTETKDVAKGLVDAMMRARNRMSTEYPEYKEKQYFRPSRFAPVPKAVEAAEKSKKRKQIAKTTNVDYTTGTSIAMFQEHERKNLIRRTAK